MEKGPDDIQYPTGESIRYRKFPGKAHAGREALAKVESCQSCDSV